MEFPLPSLHRWQHRGQGKGSDSPKVSEHISSWYPSRALPTGPCFPSVGWIGSPGKGEQSAL